MNQYTTLQEAIDAASVSSEPRGSIRTFHIHPEHLRPALSRRLTSLSYFGARWKEAPSSFHGSFKGGMVLTDMKVPPFTASFHGVKGASQPTPKEE